MHCAVFPLRHVDKISQPEDKIQKSHNLVNEF